MAYDIRFSGTLSFGVTEDLVAAHEEVHEIVGDAEPEFADQIEEMHEEWFMEDARNLIVAVDTFGPEDYVLLLTQIVEVYAAYAIGGVVESWYDDEPDEAFGPDA